MRYYSYFLTKGGQGLKYHYDLLEELLEEYKEIDLEINALNYRIQTENIRGVMYNDMPKSPNLNTNSSIEGSLLTIENLKEEIKKLETKKLSIENLLNVLSDRDKMIIKMYYIEDLTLRDIAFKLNLNDKYVSSKKNKIMHKLVPYATRFGLI